MRSRSFYQTHPVEWAEEILGVKLWQMQKSILESLVEGDVAVKSGHALGKDFLSGVMILWFLNNFKYSKVLATAPSQRQVLKVIWGELGQLYHNSKVPLGGKLLTQELRYANNWYAMGFTTKETNQKIGKAQGFHAPHQLAVITEAQAVDASIFEQLDGVMTSSHARIYVAGNPLTNTGYFWKIFNDRVLSKKYKLFTFSCYDSPNVIEKKDVFPGMVSHEWVVDKETRWGKDSPLFQSRVLGEFPTKSLHSLVSMSDLQATLSVKNPAKGLNILACDPSRFGEDQTAFAYAEGGELKELDIDPGTPTPETEDKAIGLINKHEPHKFIIDDGSFGSGIFDHVEIALQLSETEAVAFNFSGIPSDDKFENVIVEAYFKVAEWIKKKKIKLIDDSELFHQLAARNYHFSKTGKIMLESKETMKHRGMSSPDKADAVVMALFHSVVIDNSDSNTEMDFDDDTEDAFLVETDPLTGYPINIPQGMFL